LDKGRDEAVPKKVRESALDTRAARAKLRASGKPYYRTLGPELHIGYRKGKDARRWVARVYAGSGQYVVETIGHADDIADADGIHVLDFWQAQDRARRLHLDRGDNPGRYTLRKAITDYVASLAGRGRGQKEAELKLAANVPPELANRELAKITAEDLSAWMRGMIARPQRDRTGALRDIDMDDPEIVRKRKSTANRVFNTLRAALNLSYKHGKVPTDHAWRRVKAYRDADSARVQYLTVAQAQRLINACDGNFRDLVQAALLTGCRYEELTRLKVEDFNPDSATIQIRMSKSGKSRHVVLTNEGASFFADLCAGRKGSETIIGGQWRRNGQTRRMNAACKRASIDPPISFHGLRHTWASLSVMGGMPLIVVAKNLGHADTRMVEKHYGHLAPSYIADAVRKHAPQFGLAGSNVKAIR
jgi:integrase